MKQNPLSRRAELEDEFALLISARYIALREHADALEFNLAPDAVAQAAERLQAARTKLVQWCRKNQDEVDRLADAPITEIERLAYRAAELERMRDAWSDGRPDLVAKVEVVRLDVLRQLAEAQAKEGAACTP